MGARQSKRSVDITTTPKKGEGEAAPVSEDKIEKLGDADIAEVVTNGTAAHKDIEYADKDETKETEEKNAAEVKENGLSEASDGDKTPDKEDAPAAGDQPSKTSEATTESAAENGDKAAETPDAKKQKEKKKKKWSLRSISFSKKDKSKPNKDKDKSSEVEEVNEEKEETTTKASTETTNNDSNEISAEVVQNVGANEETTTKSPEVEEPSTKDDSALKVEPEAEKVSVNPAELPSSDTSKDQPKEEPAHSEVSIKSEKEDSIQETADIPSAVEEVKEVRNEDVPPPLPNSNPPSQVAVFAESLKDDSLLIDTNVNSPLSESLLKQSETLDETTNQETEKLIASEIKEVPVNTESKKELGDISSGNMGPSVDKESELTSEAQNPSLGSQTQSQNSLEKSEIPCEMPEDRSMANQPLSHEIKSDPLVDVEKTESNEIIENKISSVGDSLLSESNEEVVQNLPPSVVNPVIIDSNNLNDQKYETSNLANVDSNETTVSKLEKVSADIENQDSDTAMVEDKIPNVFPVGDVPNSNSSQTSVECDDSTLELKTNLCLEEPCQTQLCSDEKSLDSSTMPNISESKQENLIEEKIAQSELSPASVNVENGQNELLETSETLQNKKDSINVESIPSSPKDVEQLCNTDSLADLSTESLPSLPEPTDSVLEPMSLPPLDSVPDPLTDDNIPSESPVTKINETEVTLINGNATNGMSSLPTADNDETPPPLSLDGPLKQVITVQDVEETSQSIDAQADSVVESVQSEAQ